MVNRKDYKDKEKSLIEMRSAGLEDLFIRMNPANKDKFLSKSVDMLMEEIYKCDKGAPVHVARVLSSVSRIYKQGLISEESYATTELNLLAALSVFENHCQCSSPSEFPSDGKIDIVKKK